MVSEEMVGSQIQASTIMPIIMVTSLPLVISSSHPLLVVMRDINGLASLVLTDLGAIFWIDLLEQADPVATVSTLQFPVVEGLVRRVAWSLKLQSPQDWTLL